MEQTAVLELVNRHHRQVEALQAWIFILEGEFTDAELAVLYTRYQRVRRSRFEGTHEGQPCQLAPSVPG